MTKTMIKKSLRAYISSCGIVDPAHIDIRISPTLPNTVPPILNVDICFLVQLTDGGGRDPAAPQTLSNVLHPPGGEYTCPIHLNKCLFHSAFTAVVPLNDSSLKGDPLELKYLGKWW